VTFCEKAGGTNKATTARREIAREKTLYRMMIIEDSLSTDGQMNDSNRNARTPKDRIGVRARTCAGEGGKKRLQLRRDFFNFRMQRI
jgi:hypothetical protein